MHPRQASLIQQAKATLETLHTAAAPPSLWKYTCPETGNEFWTKVKKTTIRSPFTGKNFSAKPDKDTVSEVSKDLKLDREQSKKATVIVAHIPGLGLERQSFENDAEAVRWMDNLISQKGSDVEFTRIP